jgi:hypothetical protein
MHPGQIKAYRALQPHRYETAMRPALWQNRICQDLDRSRSPAGATKTITAGPVTLTPKRGSFSVYFTNGILATQALTHIVPQGKSGGPDPTLLRNRIDQPGDPLRLKLAGQEQTRGGQPRQLRPRPRASNAPRNNPRKRARRRRPRSVCELRTVKAPFHPDLDFRKATPIGTGF